MDHQTRFSIHNQLGLATWANNCDSLLLRHHLTSKKSMRKSTIKNLGDAIELEFWRVRNAHDQDSKSPKNSAGRTFLLGVLGALVVNLN
jgi:hypothetical protein